MVEAQHTTTLSGIDGEARGRTAGAEERLPIPQAAAIMITLSLGLWAIIGFGVRWLMG